MTMTLESLAAARTKYRQGVTALLHIGGIPEHVPTTEREWLLFDVNQRLRDQGVGRSLPWANHGETIAEADDKDIAAVARGLGYK